MMASHSTPHAVHYPATVFTRFNRPLHTVWLESQAWFSAKDLGRLMGRFLDERALRKLDPDQTRTLSVLHYGVHQLTPMISESGVYTVLLHHYLPENRSLRRWITLEVIALLRDRARSVVGAEPCLDELRWPGLSVSVLHWHDEQWVRMKDLPEVLKPSGFAQPNSTTGKRRFWKAFRVMIGFTK